MFKKLFLSLLLTCAVATSAFSAPELFRPDDISDNLQGYWKLDDDFSATGAVDSSGNGNTLTDNNTVTEATQDYWDTGETSADIELSNSEYLSITDGSQTGLDITGNITLSAFVKYETVQGQVVSKWTATGSQKGWTLQQTSGAIELYVSSDGSAATGVVGATTLAVGKWYHVAGVYDGATIRVYLNGNLDGSAAYTSGINDNTSAVIIGGQNATGNSDGLFKDVAVWNTALTPIQIKSLAMGVDLENESYRPDDVSTAPDAWWKLNELSGNRSDSSGNSHTLTDNASVLSEGGYTEGVAAYFEAANSEYLSRADNTDFDFAAGDFSLSYWIRADAGWTDNHSQVCQYELNNDRGWTSGYNDSSFGGFIFGYSTDGTISTQTIYDTSWAIPSDGDEETWYHIVWRRDGADLQFFVDGEQKGTTHNISTTTIYNSSANLTIGANLNSGAASSPFDGRIADVGLWKGYALTDDEIASLASAFPIQQSGIVSYWNMDEASGTRTDSIGSNDLTDNNTVGTATGLVGDGADFESANTEYLSITDASQTGLDITDDLSILAFAKYETVGGTILSKWTATGSKKVYSAQQTLSVLQFLISNDGSTSNALTGATTLSTGQFYGTGYIYDGAEMRVYLDSAEDGSTAYSSGITDQDSPVIIGGVNGTGTFDGITDEVLVANRWFRDEEIKSVYNKGLNGLEVTSEPNPATAGVSFKPRIIII